MEKVNGGTASKRRCDRIMTRSNRHASRGDLDGGNRLSDKYEDLGC